MSPLMRILLTGFEPFGDFAVNPSQAIVERLAAGYTLERGYDLCTAILPVAYAEAGERILALLAETRPDAVLLLGVAGKRSTLSLERVALNLDEAAKPDNRGEVTEGRLIVPGGPVGYWSTLPLPRFYAALVEHGIPVSMSHDAGAYLCNHVFYVARHALESANRPIPCGFIHVPPMAEQARTDEERAKSLPLDMMVQAVSLCLDALAAAA